MINDSNHLRRLIAENAVFLHGLHKRLHETCRQYRQGLGSAEAWHDAVAEFKAQYPTRCFPGGYPPDILDRIVAGDPTAMEAALCFLEVRPFFFHSGYMWKDLIRKCKKAPLSPEQAERFRIVMEKRAEWMERKAAVRKANEWPRPIHPQPKSEE